MLAGFMLFNLTWEKLNMAYDSAHRAALEFHDAMNRFENPDSESFWNFSSTAAYGNMGQFNYSSFNTILDWLARHGVGIGQPSLTIQWGASGEVARPRTWTPQA